ncbi:helix-turn-helix transcriptional regulator [Nocardia yamanashiensis]|uniref:helix-turn-helix transcriptional regulator n=1 Tax=Nocardia yamanashiensis TaxID=209247 RepID=UPI000A9BE773|nr:AraC family transcriptional regulator [Nocardia yamanashiensis]
MPVRSEFSTTDPERAREYITTLFGDTRIRVSGDPAAFRFELERCDIGPVRFDTVRNSLTTGYEKEPLGSLMVCRILRHTMAFDTGASCEHYGPGEVFLAAHPHRAHRSTLYGTHVQAVGLDVALLQQAAGDTGTSEQLLDRLRYGRLPPAAARFWQHSVDYLTESLALVDDSEAGSLLVGNAGQLLAAVLLTASGDGPADGAGDRADATRTTVRRATAFIETNPDLDLGVADIARASNVSPRAVQLAFRRHLDTTPMHYLRRVRLERAREELRAAAPGDRITVTAVAARWGYLRPSRFAAHYFAIYGEYPAQTLRGS